MLLMHWFRTFSKIRSSHVRLAETTNFRLIFTNNLRLSHIFFDHVMIFKKCTYVLIQKYFSKIAFLSKYCKSSYKSWFKEIENSMSEKINSKDFRHRSTELWTIEISLLDTAVFQILIYKSKTFSNEKQK